MSYEIVTLPAYRAVGLKWEGTFSEIVPNLKHVIQQMEDRADELEHKELYSPLEKIIYEITRRTS